MKLHTVIQGEPEWFALRMGIPTASEFHRIVQPGGEPRFKKNGEPYKSKAGELAEGRWTYAYELAAERLLGESKDAIDGLLWVERGKLLEDDARKHAEFALRLKTVKAGFITTDDGRWGCSPDRIVYDGNPPDLGSEEALRTLGGLEIKVPSPARHIQYFDQEGPGMNYRCQVQGSLLVTGFKTWHFLSYHPGLPQVIVAFERDEEFIAKLREGLEQFSAEVDEICEKIKTAGYVPPPTHITGPIDKAYGEAMRWDDMNAVEQIIENENWGG